MLPVPDQLRRNRRSGGQIEFGKTRGGAAELGAVGAQWEVDGAPQQEIFVEVVLEDELYERAWVGDIDEDIGGEQKEPG